MIPKGREESVNEMITALIIMTILRKIKKR